MYDIIPLPSSNYGTRGGGSPIGVILHCIGLPFEDVIESFTRGKVSAHYFIPQLTMQEIIKKHPELVEGMSFKYPGAVPVISFVPEEQSAWHAGISSWKNWNELSLCEKSLNACTIGIEFHAPGYNDIDANDISHFVEYSQPQMQTGIALIKDITKRWNIDAENILAHSDVAFLRAEGPSKTDPGPYFPWHMLERDKLGVFDDIGGIEGDEIYVQSKLRKIGYNCPQSGILDKPTKHCINAYRLRFMGDKWRAFNGEIDAQLLEKLYYHCGGDDE